MNDNTELIELLKIKLWNYETYAQKKIAKMEKEIKELEEQSNES